MPKSPCQGSGTWARRRGKQATEWFVWAHSSSGGNPVLNSGQTLVYRAQLHTSPCPDHGVIESWGPRTSHSSYLMGNPPLPQKVPVCWGSPTTQSPLSPPASLLGSLYGVLSLTRTLCPWLLTRPLPTGSPSYPRWSSALDTPGPLLSATAPSE